MTSDKAGGSSPASSADPANPARPARQSEALARLEGLARYDPGGRGLSSKAPTGLLEPAAMALLAARRVMIVTGFCVRSAMTGETDGPPGASALASALVSLGSTVMILTDRHSAGLVAAALAARTPPTKPGMDTNAEKVTELDAEKVISPDARPGLTTGQVVPVATLPDDDREAAQACLDLASSFAPDLILAVERPGGAADGHRYSMRGTLLDDIAPSADILFTSAENRGWKTAAIGDGGNELGMGSLRDSCVSAVALGQQIFCAAGSDFPVVAGISNWGAYALAGAISILAGMAVLPAPAEELLALQAVYEAGGVDGATREHSCTVDGLPADEYLRTIRQMYTLVLESI
ncbi:MAG: DUF4392 domain-containing protein [Spirochaetota bacterium]